MRIIDILNKKAEKRLKEGERFIYNNLVFVYKKNEDRIKSARNNKDLGEIYKVEEILLDKIELIKIDEEE